MDMLDELAALRERWKPSGLPLIEIGVGVNTGEAVVGNFGSQQRFSYTAMGDDVNLASRLEGLNKQFGTTALVADGTRQAIGDAFVCREIDRAAPIFLARCRVLRDEPPGPVWDAVYEATQK